MEFEKDQLHSLIKRHIPNCQEENALEPPVKVQRGNNVEEGIETEENIALSVDDGKYLIPSTSKIEVNMPPAFAPTGLYCSQIHEVTKKEDKSKASPEAKRKIITNIAGEIHKGIQHGGKLNFYVQRHEKLEKSAEENVTRQENDVAMQHFGKEDAARTMLEIQHSIKSTTEYLQKTRIG